MPLAHYRPPVTGSMIPLMNPAASEARKATASPTSRGWPTRPSGISLILSAISSSGLVVWRTGGACGQTLHRALQPGVKHVAYTVAEKVERHDCDSYEEPGVDDHPPVRGVHKRRLTEHAAPCSGGRGDAETEEAQRCLGKHGRAPRFMVTRTM